MSKGDWDLDGAVQKDIQKLQQVGSMGSPDLGALLEGVFGAVAICAMIGMVVVMPWVGDGGVLSGRQWLGFSLVGVCLFGGLAVAIREVRERAPEADRQMDKRFEGGR